MSKQIEEYYKMYIWYRANESHHVIDRRTSATWWGSIARYKINLFYKQAMDYINAARIDIWSENIMSIIIPSLSEVKFAITEADLSG